jgi:hypothetical protein
MLYRNTTQTHLHLWEHRFLEPGGVIELDETSVKNPNIRSLVSEKNWLTPVLENATTNLINGEVERVNHPVTHPAPPTTTTNNNTTLNLNFSHNATQHPLTNRKTWNPMDDAYHGGEDEEFYVPQPVSKDEYGTHEYDEPDNDVLMHTGENSSKPVQPARRVIPKVATPEDLLMIKSIQEKSSQQPPKTSTSKTRKAKKED